MRKVLVQAALLAVGLLSTPTLAAESGRMSPADRFKEMDANGDGKITRAEATASAKARFAEMDKNSDAKITVDELPSGGRWDPAKFIERMDSDGDGAVSQKEWVDRALERFDRKDTDGDGVLSPEEQQAAIDSRGSGHRDR